jgi:hypothetical protein
MKKNEAIDKLIQIKKIAEMVEYNAGDVPRELPKRGPKPMRVGVNGVIYDSIETTAAAFGVHPMTVRNRCANPSKKFKGWTFVYTP